MRLFRFSAGAHLTAEWGTDNKGFVSYGCEPPKALVLCYAPIDLHESECASDHRFLDSVCGGAGHDAIDDFCIYQHGTVSADIFGNDEMSRRVPGNLRKMVDALMRLGCTTRRLCIQKEDMRYGTRPSSAMIARTTFSEAMTGVDLPGLGSRQETRAGARPQVRGHRLGAVAPPSPEGGSHLRAQAIVNSSLAASPGLRRCLLGIESVSVTSLSPRAGTARGPAPLPATSPCYQRGRAWRF